MLDSMAGQARKRVIFFGDCSYTFMQPLAKMLTRKRPVRISVCGLLVSDAELQQDVSLFEERFEHPDSKVDLEILHTPSQKLLVVRDRGSGHQLSHLTPLVAHALTIKDRKPLEKALARDLVAKRYAELFSDYDLCHMQFFKGWQLSAFRYLGRKTRKLISIWGSDLLRTSGTEIYQEQSEALEACDRVTVQTVEMKHILLSKYGRQLEPKVRLVPFYLDPELIARLDAQDDASVAAFRSAHDIARDRVVVTVGYSGHPRNNQLVALEVLARLPMELHDKLTLLVPMTYNTPPGYLAKVRRIAERSPLDIRILDTFLDLDGVAQLRLASDVMIQVPDSDAQSFSMQESLAAGSIVIAGAWLPYGTLLRRGLRFQQIDEIAELPDRVRAAVDEMAARGRPKRQRQPIVELSIEQSEAAYCAVYDELIG
jgi:glycosyltransferase involved in cell wall biosynthesis